MASPEAHDYYFVWLIFPIAALIDFYRTARPGRERRVLAVSLAGAMVCMALAINGAPIVFQAYGCLDWAVAFLIFGLVFEIALRQAGAADSATPSPRNRGGRAVAAKPLKSN